MGLRDIGVDMMDHWTTIEYSGKRWLAIRHTGEGSYRFGQCIVLRELKP